MLACLGGLGVEQVQSWILKGWKMFFYVNSWSRLAHLKLFWCRHRVAPRITSFKNMSKKMQQAQAVAKVRHIRKPIYFQIFSVLAGMFHVNLCRGSWGPTGSVLNFEMMKHAFFCLNSLSRNAHLKLFWCQQRVPPRITGFKSRIYATYVKHTSLDLFRISWHVLC